MKAKLSLKTLYRSPVRTALTFILLAAVTFALFSQVLEYAIADRELKKAITQYEGVLSVQLNAPYDTSASTPSYAFSDTRVDVSSLPLFHQTNLRNQRFTPLSEDLIDKLSSLPYITYVDRRYMTAGYSDTYQRVDDGREYYNYTSQCVVEATVKAKVFEYITVTDVKLLGGVPKRDFDEEGTYIWAEKTKEFEFEVEFLADQYKQTPVVSKEDIEKWEERHTHYYAPIERASTMVTKNSKYGYAFLEDIEIGKRYIFVLRYEDYHINYTDTEQYYLTDPFASQYTDAVIPTEGLPENYLETEAFAGLRGYIDRINRNLWTFDVVYTDTTDTIRYFADKTIGIFEGRGLTREDTANKSNVCVIHHDMATAHGLEVGDTITLELGDKLFEQYVSKGAVDISPSQVPENLTEVTLEIVGTFKDSRSDDIVTSDPSWSYSANTVFVPSHLLNVSDDELENHRFTPAEISFVVDNAWDIPAFKDKCLPLIVEQHFFTDGGFSELLESYRETERLSLIKLCVLSASTFVCICFAAFLYIVGKHRDYAIMRVLGTSKKKSGSALLLPLLVLTCTAVFIGSAVSILYTQQTILNSDSIEFLSNLAEVDTSIPPIVVALCIAGVILLTLLVALFLLTILGRNPPLALIQERTRKQKAKKVKKKKVIVPESTEPVTLGEWVSIEPVKRDGKRRRGAFITRYILRHIRRTAGKVIMLLLVTALLLSVSAQLLIMDAAYNKIFDETEITSNYAGYLNLNYVNELINSGYVHNVYYQDNNGIEVNGFGGIIHVTSDIDRYTGNDLNVTYLDGYDSSVMQQLGEKVLIVSNVLAEHKNITLGDTVYLSRIGLYKIIEDSYMTKYTDDVGPPPEKYVDNRVNGEYEIWYGNFEVMYRDIIEEEYRITADPFLVVGIAESETRRYSSSVFTPGCLEVNFLYGKLTILDVIEATLTDNHKAEEYHEYGTALAAKNLTGEIAFLMDTSTLDSVSNNMKLMDMLFPIVTAAILVIAAFLCSLLIVQTSKDIAIMRVLGTSKRTVRTLMVLEHTVICFIGILLSLAVCSVRQMPETAIPGILFVSAMYLIAALLSSVIASIAASRKNVLELLQTKE